MQPFQIPKPDRDLRAELDAAIQIQRAERMKADFEAAQRAATHRHAKTISDALGAGSEPPCGI